MAAISSYTPIATTTVATAANSYTFSSIPSTYTDLQLVIAGTLSAGATMQLVFNGDTTNVYSGTSMYGDGTSAYSSRLSNNATYQAWIGNAYTTQFNATVNIMNYANTTTYKTLLSRMNNSANNVFAVTSMWRSTAAINSIEVKVAGGLNLAVGTTLSLYGIANNTAGAKATGGVISSDSEYFYHSFYATGTFTPTQSLSCDYLVVAGGGGGSAGGGGAGGYLTSIGGSPLSVTATAYTITVGAGGGGTSPDSAVGNNGSNSVFSTITSTGGGGGGAATPNTAGNGGGSGGGGGNDGTPALLAGGARTASPVQGNNGGSNGGNTNNGLGGGGGGGAGAVGATGASSAGGAGGAGLSSSINGTATLRGGGGGGNSFVTTYTGTGGTGGGGAGSGNNANGVAGTISTGGGGGGAGNTRTGGSGGSGVVIIRYARQGQIMANETYTLIQKTTLNASAASITFSSIPQTFTDLKVVLSARDVSVTYSSLYIAINGTAVTSLRKVLGNGSSASSGTDYVGLIDGTASTASVFGNADIYIPNYTSSNYKSLSIDMVTENNATGAHQFLTAAISPATAAISTLAFTCDGSFEKYTSVSLYGVAKQGVNPVAGPKATGGDVITNDGTYWIHQFLNSGTFTPSQTLSTEYLVVAGGGGGGCTSGGGGGAGGYRTASGYSLTGSSSYTVTIGAGGAGSTNNGARGVNGSDSLLNSITSAGGGGGGSASVGFRTGLAGGSGGGGAGQTATSEAGGTATPSGQGNAGGANSASAAFGAGGGGGAGAVGGAGTTTVSGAGGAGSASSITGTSVTRGGGGGGAETGSGATAGAGGSGGGGYGSSTATNPPATGTLNTGGGGGASHSSGVCPAAAGGSGIVIIRYAI